MNWKEINKMSEYLIELGYKVESMSIPQILNFYCYEKNIEEKTNE